MNRNSLDLSSAPCMVDARFLWSTIPQINQFWVLWSDTNEAWRGIHGSPIPLNEQLTRRWRTPHAVPRLHRTIMSHDSDGTMSATPYWRRLGFVETVKPHFNATKGGESSRILDGSSGIVFLSEISSSHIVHFPRLLE